MAEGLPSAFPVDLTRKWRALAERRKAYLVGLYDSGRWRLYYTEQEFVLRMREAVRIVEQWSATEQSAARDTARASIAPAGAADRLALGGAEKEAQLGAEADDGADLGDRDAALLSEADTDDAADVGNAGLLSEAAADDGADRRDAEAQMLSAEAADSAGSCEQADAQMRYEADLRERRVA